MQILQFATSAGSATDLFLALGHEALYIRQGVALIEAFSDAIDSWPFVGFSGRELSETTHRLIGTHFRESRLTSLPPENRRRSFQGSNRGICRNPT